LSQLLLVCRLAIFAAAEIIFAAAATPAAASDEEFLRFHCSPPVALRPSDAASVSCRHRPPRLVFGFFTPCSLRHTPRLRFRSFAAEYILLFITDELRHHAGCFAELSHVSAPSPIKVARHFSPAFIISPAALRRLLFSPRVSPPFHPPIYRRISYAARPFHAA